MKQTFSTNWLSSVQPRKQRKFKAKAPLHIKQKFASSHLAKPLRTRYNRRSVPIRKGDEVKVLRGSFKKKTAKVTEVDLIRNRVTLENLQRTKKDGTKVAVYFSPSSLQITSLDTNDKKRIKSLEKSKSPSTTQKKPEDQTKKSEEKVNNKKAKKTTKKETKG